MSQEKAQDEGRIRAACPGCGAAALVKSSMIGRKVRCPRCQEAFTVTPAPEATPAEPAAAGGESEATTPTPSSDPFGMESEPKTEPAVATPEPPSDPFGTKPEPPVTPPEAPVTTPEPPPEPVASKPEPPPEPVASKPEPPPEPVAEPAATKPQSPPEPAVTSPKATTPKATALGKDTDIDRASPDKLMTGFTKTPLMMCILVALGLHVTVVLATSVGSILDWADPSRVEAREELAKAKRKEEAEAAKTKAGAATEGATAKSETAGPKDKQGKLLEKHKGTAVVKGITEKADAKEIPKVPDLGISIDDTNPF